MSRPGSARAGSRSRRRLPSRATRSTCGPPGNGRPRTRATLSKASPAASSIEAPSGRMSWVTSGTSSSDEWPPETSRASVGSGSGPCSTMSTATCEARWFTPYSGLPSATASDLAAATPTMSEPGEPGAGGHRDRVEVAEAHARLLAGPLDRRAPSPRGGPGWPPRARRRRSGRARRRCWRWRRRAACSPRTMPTPVSSQEVSMPSTRGWSALTVCLPSGSAA